MGGGGGGAKFSTCIPSYIRESFKSNAWYIKFIFGLLCDVTITLYAYILVCFLVPLVPKQHKLLYLAPLFLQVKIIRGGGGSGPPCYSILVIFFSRENGS